MIALLDSNVLYPPGLRDLLMWLAVVLAYEPRWTEDIHAEWMRNVLNDRPEVTPAQMERTRRLMDQVNPKCLVRGYEARVPALTLPDEDDRHVLAAAIEAGAETIVTFNLRHFPRKALAPYDLRALPPDLFLEALLDANPARFLCGMRQHRASLRNPPKTAEEYLSALAARDCPEPQRGWIPMRRKDKYEEDHSRGIARRGGGTDAG